MNGRLGLVSIALAFAYAGSYAGFRQTHKEVWAKNGRTYVIFPKGNSALYYGFRPLSFVDGKITGIGFHIGPHR